MEQQRTPGRVLVAEDEALIRLDLVEMLREEGYEVVAAVEDGEQAIARTEEMRPDVVLLDVRMPRLDGISAAERISAAGLAAVVMLTAFSQRDLVERAVAAGAMSYLVKPVARADLVPAIEVALGRFAQVRALEGEVTDLADRLAARKVIDRAKSVLQQRLDISEPEAFRWIQRTAMDLRRPMQEVAEGLLTELGPASDTPRGTRADTPE